MAVHQPTKIRRVLLYVRDAVLIAGVFLAAATVGASLPPAEPDCCCRVASHG